MFPRLSIKSYVLLFVQLACIGYILIAGGIVAQGAGFFVQAVGVLLGVWAVAVMRLGHFNIFPDLLEKSQLVTRGPYRFIRHPMYTAILLICIPLVIAVPTIANHIALLVLIADLFFKLTYEEKLLGERFPEYAEYRKRTKRLIPWVF
jgi:protein-S-isoprenylcysteine O-methyltransferase Ste14